MKQPAAPLVLVALSSTLLLFFGMAAFVAGSIAAACACLLALPIIAALATFRCKVTPLSVAVALSLPVAALATLFAKSNPVLAAGLAWAAFVAFVFVVGLLAACFGRYRKRKLDVRCGDV
jgi:hypothetical protein